MNFSDEQKSKDNSPSAGSSSSSRPQHAEFIVTIAASVLTLAATFFLTTYTGLDFTIKTAIFGAIVFTYLCFCAFFYYLRIRRRKNSETLENVTPSTTSSAAATAAGAPETANQEIVFSPEIQEKLLVLEQANSFFSSSLKSADMFRLVSNRIVEIVPFATCALFLTDENKTLLRAEHTSGGENTPRFSAREIAANDETTVGRAFSSRRAQFGEDLSGEKNASESSNKLFAVPLRNRDHEPYGVLALYVGGEEPLAGGEQQLPLLEAISARISPLFLNSLAFERSLENALTDSLTGLANQRAFYLVLENQLAESQRFGEQQRPLTVLAIDIRDFDELNRNYGHATGDKVLSLTAKIIKGQLRQMDFLARASGDEFLAILPTASEEITKVIIERIEKAFRQNPFDAAAAAGGREKIHVRLNFGAASFVRDGETAQDLLKIAALKKQQAKGGDQGSIVFFPREYVN